MFLVIRLIFGVQGKRNDGLDIGGKAKPGISRTDTKIVVSLNRYAYKTGNRIRQLLSQILLCLSGGLATNTMRLRTRKGRRCEGLVRTPTAGKTPLPCRREPRTLEVESRKRTGSEDE